MSDHQKMLQHRRNLFCCSELRISCLFCIVVVVVVLLFSLFVFLFLLLKWGEGGGLGG